ncbi:MAG: hypothetical protein RLZZ200_2480 [Pseudomonadota bacterium]|jgi:hypothetical protein
MKNRVAAALLTHFAALPCALGIASSPADAAADTRPRVVVTADPELDDLNSLIRFLLYTPDFRVEGLIYASSQFHWKGDGRGTTLSVPGREYNRFGLNLCPCKSWRWSADERFIDDAVDAYEKAWPNLRVHDPAYPTPAALRSKIRWGNVEFDGEMSKDTPGSESIVSLLLDKDDSPVYLHAWGGQSTIARALKAIEERHAGTEHWQEIRKRVVSKAVIHASGDQDGTYAAYIRPKWPEIRYRRLAGGVPLSYNAQSRVSEADAAYYTPDWIRMNVSRRGALGALYRVWGDGKQMVKGDRFDYFGVQGKTAKELRDEGYVVWTPVHPQGAFLGEGDTFTYMNLIDNGLRGYRDESLGGWGGAVNDAEGASFEISFTNIEGFASNPATERSAPRDATHPFLAAAQRDFAVRMLWATTPRHEEANHPPRIAALGRTALSTQAGKDVSLRVRTQDPDRHSVTVHWRIWPEAGSYRGPVTLGAVEGLRTDLTVPADAAPGQTIHVVAEATDNGSPALTRYERYVITVR